MNRRIPTFITATLVALSFAACTKTSSTEPNKSDPQSSRAGVPEAIQQIQQVAGGNVSVSLNPLTEVAKFVRIPAGGVSLPGATIEEKAGAFFDKYGKLFGIRDPRIELKLVSSRIGVQMSHVRYRQTYGGVDVFGGDLRATFNKDEELIAVNGVFVPDLDVDPTVQWSADVAEAVAVRHVQRQQSPDTILAALSSELMIFRTGLLQKIPGSDHLVYEVEVANPTRSVREFVYVDAHFGKVVDQITGIHDTLTRKVYESALAPANLVFSEGDAEPMTSGGSAQQLIDWNNEISGAKETYNTFASLTNGAWLSYDAASAVMETVNNDPSINCPNANWNGISTNYCTGVTGDDTVAHEWGHAYTEYTSNLIYQWQSGALNEAYSDIWGEIVDLSNGRGSDDNGSRTPGGCSTLGEGSPSVDATYRWLSGEDDPAFNGAIRDLWNPNCYGDPGAVTDSEYWCSTSDGGGVHTNSGVPNRTFALMVDGGTVSSASCGNGICEGGDGENCSNCADCRGVTRGPPSSRYCCGAGEGCNGTASCTSNGYQCTMTPQTAPIAGLGLLKAANIHWAAQRDILTEASDFSAHADALETACAGLIGANLYEINTSNPTGVLSAETINADDCQAVTDIIGVTQLRATPGCGFTTLLNPQAPDLCGGATPIGYFSENWESTTIGDPGGWTAGTRAVANAASFDTPDWAVVSSLPDRSGSGAFVADDPALGLCTTADTEAGVLFLDSPSIAIPADATSPKIAFWHWVATEAGWDGGNVKISVNGGSFNLVSSSRFTFNGYNSSLNSAAQGSDNPLAGQSAFTGTDGGSNGGTWGQSQIDLAGIASPGDDIQIRFEMGLDGCYGIVGWYLDEVEVYSCPAGGGCAPLGASCSSDGECCSSKCKGPPGGKTCK